MNKKKKALRHKALRQLKLQDKAKYQALKADKTDRELDMLNATIDESYSTTKRHLDLFFKSIITHVQEIVNDIDIPLQSEFATPDSFIKIEFSARNPRTDYIEEIFGISVPEYFEDDKDLTEIETLYPEYAYDNGLNWIGTGREGSKRSIQYATNLQKAMDVTGANTSPEKLFNELVTKHLRTSRTVAAAFENAQREFEAIAYKYFYESDQVRIEEGRKKFGTYVEKGSDIRALMNK